MTTSTNNTSLGYIEETVPGTTPSNPAFQILPTTGGGITASLTTAVSNVIRNDGAVDDLVVVDSDVGGSVNYELSFTPYLPFLEDVMRAASPSSITTTATGDLVADKTGSQFTSTTTNFTTEGYKVGDLFLAVGFGGTPEVDGVYRVTSVAANALGVNPAPPADASPAGKATLITNFYKNNQVNRKSWTFQKKVTGITTPAYFNYRGCAISGMSLNFATAAILTGSMNVIGLTEEATETPIAGETELPVQQYSLMNSVDSIHSIRVEGLSATSCFQSLNLNINRNTNASKCIGTLGATGLADFTNEITADVTLYFEDLVTYNKFKNSEAFSVIINLVDGDGNTISIFLPKCKFTSLDVPVDGKDQFLTLNGSFQALNDASLGYQMGLMAISGADIQAAQA